MAFVKISVPEIQINDNTYRIIANSFEYDGGEGEITVSSTSAGSGNSETVHAENAETQIGMCKFSIPLLSTTDKDIRDWKDNIATNTVKATQIKTGAKAFIVVFPGASLTNSVNRQASADGAVELEFKGDMMIIQ